MTDLSRSIARVFHAMTSCKAGVIVFVYLSENISWKWLSILINPSVKDADRRLSWSREQ